MHSHDGIVSLPDLPAANQQPLGEVGRTRWNMPRPESPAQLSPYVNHQRLAKDCEHGKGWLVGYIVSAYPGAGTVGN